MKNQMTKQLMMAIVVVALANATFAGLAGLAVKGAMKTWDEVAKVALKTSGRTVSDDAVKAAAKTLEETSAKYGDDIARASMRGGLEVAEQVAKHGGRFAKVVKASSCLSDVALRELALHGETAVRVCATHGSERVVQAMAKLPAEDGTRLLGAIERNPGVAKELLAGTEQGGKEFLDRLFAINGRQILAGTLGAAAIVGVVRKTAPDEAEADAIRSHAETATELAKSGKELSEGQQRLVDDWSGGTTGGHRIQVRTMFAGGLTLAFFVGVAFLVFAIRKSRPAPVCERAENNAIGCVSRARQS